MPFRLPTDARESLQNAADQADDLTSEYELLATQLLAVLDAPPQSPTLPVLHVENARTLSRVPTLVRPFTEVESIYLRNVVDRMVLNAEGYRRYANAARELIDTEWGTGTAQPASNRDQEA